MDSSQSLHLSQAVSPTEMQNDTASVCSFVSSICDAPNFDDQRPQVEVPPPPPVVGQDNQFNFEENKDDQTNQIRHTDIQ